MAEPKKPAIAALAVFGKPKGGASAPPKGDPESEPTVPEDFEDYAAQAFPELDGDDARMSAFWKAVKACVKAGDY